MRRTLALVAAAALAVIGFSAAAFASGSSQLAGGSSSESTGTSTEHKVTICHHTRSKKHPWVTISVDQHALAAHMKHGDTVGPCPPTGTTAAKTTSARHTHGHHGKHKGKHHGHGHGGHGHGHAK